MPEPADQSGTGDPEGHEPSGPERGEEATSGPSSPTGRGGDEPTTRPARPGRFVPRGDTPPGIFLGEDPPPAGGTPAGEASGPERRHEDARWGDVSSLAALASALLLVPLAALALLPFWAVLNLVADVGFVPLFAGYLLAGGVLFLRSTQRLLLGVFFGSRPPTPRELATLEPAWRNVADAAGIDADRYVLAVSDRAQLDAVATGGHIVAVSHLALTVLPPGELEAALAHELGHHLGLHSAGRVAALWLEAPILLFARLGQWLELTAYVLALAFAWRASTSETPVTITSAESWEQWGAAFGALAAGLGVRAASHLLPVAFGVSGMLHTLRSLVGRFSIYYADQVAVDLGYGEDLIELLERGVEYQLDPDPDSTLDRLWGTQSLIAKRIDRIEARLQP